MLTYKDMTFCVNDKCKKPCGRKLTEEITVKAKKFGLPLAVSNYLCTSFEESNETEEMS